ncbi:MAG: hypothetical protein A2845_00385 [Candidatus Lloydbacteria bacterium RIFCSPHIGHO2_01_FULL_49_22]|uniref:DUF5667 domain-containing protein n=1 Tax=Candidatus Lloydbacteria bacterium RIFCSPHIGHO2_01_FULL_49_22 TaxID=1798658 RepID=A0A1G2D006_9BACT|nr:MAG: hypothetical protein A2845_00385 [Candidatus Lloydbacteria bacterium RIFCSPHIGHO2_01_FULL_49_22]OGZ09321.1 MAG: hypothetical protein A3C14_05290 [Candidatus Lloydbacteria bacterium RIFCSPHIGHO2_02_FULL_50_18]
MKTTQLISFSVLGLLLCTPLSALAQQSEEATVAPVMMRNNLPRVMPLPPRGATTTRSQPLGTPATKERMVASGTRSLPPQIKREMEERDRLIGSGTPPLGERKERIDERRQEMNDRKEERRSEILKRMARQMIGRMNAAIERIEKLADRVDSRIAKLIEKGVDTTSATANVAITRTKITEARAAVAKAEASILGAATQADAMTGSTTPSDAGKPVREALEEARIAVVAAHKALVVAIVSLKANVKIEGVAATSTASSTVN